MKSEIWIVEIGAIEVWNGIKLFNTMCISSEAYTSLDKAIAFVENRYGFPSPVEELHLVWKSNSADELAYRIKGLTLVS